MILRRLTTVFVLAACPTFGADSVFLEGAFTGSWGASFPPFVPNVIGPIVFMPMDADDAIAKITELRGAAFVAQNCPGADEKREFYGGEYDYNKIGEFYGCTNGEMFFGVYRDFAGGDNGTITVEETFPDADPPRWTGVYTDRNGLEGNMRGVYQGGGIPMPLAREGSQPELVTLSGASFNGDHGLAPESFVTSFGEGLADDVYVDPELPETLGGVTVVLTDSQGAMHNARLYVVSPTQINFLVPTGVAPGPATVQVIGGGGGGVLATETVEIAAVAPGIFTAAASGQGVAAAVFLRVEPGGARSDGLIFDGSLAALTLDFGPEGSDLYVFLFSTGMRNFTGEVTVTVDGMPVPFAGPVAQGQFEGLDQLNLGPLPRSLAGRGEVEIVVTVDGKQANVVTAKF